LISAWADFPDSLQRFWRDFNSVNSWALRGWDVLEQAAMDPVREVEPASEMLTELEREVLLELALDVWVDGFNEALVVFFVGPELVVLIAGLAEDFALEDMLDLDLAERFLAEDRVVTPDMIGKSKRIDSWEEQKDKRKYLESLKASWFSHKMSHLFRVRINLMQEQYSIVSWLL
jgi:hypothetical protein